MAEYPHNVRFGSFASLRRAARLRRMSAMPSMRPNLCVATNRRDVPDQTHTVQQKSPLTRSPRRRAAAMMKARCTSPTTPSAANEAVIRPVAVLLWRSAVNPAPAPNAAKRLRSAFERRRTQIGTERSHGPALDHVQAPKRQGDAPHQVEENERTHRASIMDNIRALWTSVRSYGGR